MGKIKGKRSNGGWRICDPISLNPIPRSVPISESVKLRNLAFSINFS